MFEQALNFFAGSSFSAIKFFCGFLILPFLFLNLSAQIHKEFRASWSLVLCPSGRKSSMEADRLREEIEKVEAADLRAFNIDLWLVIAAAVFIAGIFSMGEIAQHSKLIFVEGQHFTSGTQLTEANRDQVNFITVRAIMNFYGISLVLLTAYYFYARYINALKQIGKIEKMHYINSLTANEIGD